MLPFALKVAWFVLSLTGVLGSWVGFPRFTTALNGLWIPVMFCLADTIMQSIFCLGMIWKMDPTIMPQGFCIAQAAVSAVSWFTMTTICATMTLMTSLAILRSHGMLDAVELRRALKWRHLLLLSIVGFPLIAFVAYIVVSLKTDAVRQSDAMICEATNPIWVSLLSFAGVPLLLAFPSFVLSCISVVILLFGQQQHHIPSHAPCSNNCDAFTPMPVRRNSRPKGKPLEPERDDVPDSAVELDTLSSLDNQRTSNNAHMASSRQKPRPIVNILPAHSLSTDKPYRTLGRATIPNHTKRHPLPFSWGSSTTRSSPEYDEHRRERLSNYSQSLSPMSFVSRSVVSSARTSPISISLFTSVSPRDTSASALDEANAVREEARMSGVRVVTGYEDVEGDWSSGSMKWAHHCSDVSSYTKSELEFTHTESEVDAEEFAMYARRSTLYSLWDLSYPDPRPACRSRVVWRIMFFQLFLSLTQILAAMSSLVDMFSGRTVPTSFGTQHVALILIAWASPIAFGVWPLRQHNH
ncbi:uncharacterized protein LAESUDRAFT_644789 [Laetiporus sulphureus 93-53]|uniref:G-protein coupled receptors family 1 profile domain-containing protein n=1 Tax=Laetiporus sulphureus 93-53 TaxID=1314785 RepID=A0A165GGU2_9APHY|nr:uncharacterized protein LAESUDRAFT_644789 [Laetiporus sulphureus 93-53]KZT10325.1 hypothetical protein LAESUDRAFT_644789 [Laetiporus sulphureus 93-53]